MREIRQSGSEGGVAFGPSLPLSPGYGTPHLCGSEEFCRAPHPRFMESLLSIFCMRWDHEPVHEEATCLESRLQAACLPKARRRQVRTV